MTRSQSPGSPDMSEPRKGAGDVGDQPVPPRPVLEVLWRPGCPYCSALRRELDRRGVSAVWRNIWDDDTARSLVRAANNGNETVPTVRVGDRILTNPRWAQLQPLLGDGPWMSTQTAPTAGSATRVLSWLPMLALIALSYVLDITGHTAASWVVDPFAVAAWWFTRPLRR